MTTGSLTYEKLMKGVDAGFYRNDKKRKYFENLKDGQFNIINKYSEMHEAKKTRQRFQVYMTKKTLVKDFSIKITNLTTPKGITVFIVAVVKLTDNDRIQKAELTKELSKRFKIN
jgi:hypothetical protein